jgi:hypothetical protein
VLPEVEVLVGHAGRDGADAAPGIQVLVQGFE